MVVACKRAVIKKKEQKKPNTQANESPVKLAEEIPIQP